MDLFEALEEMRKITKGGGFFSFTFMSHYRSKQTSSGIVEVAKAKLRKRDTKKHNENAEIMENYLDVNTNQPKEFYQCLLMSLNGVQVTLK